MASNGGPNSRVWAIAMALISALFGLVIFLFQREVTTINNRLDRVVDYVIDLEKDNPRHPPLEPLEHDGPR